MVMVCLSLIRPKTNIAKRFSAIFLGEGLTCECDTNAQELNIPHECTNTDKKHDVVTGSDKKDKKNTIVTINKKKTETLCIPVREDPHRMKYKNGLAITFLSCSLLYLVLDILLQVKSGSVSQWEEMEEEANLVTVLIPLTYIKQIINPVILLYTEFILS